MVVWKNILTANFWRFRHQPLPSGPGRMDEDRSIRVRASWAAWLNRTGLALFISALIVRPKGLWTDLLTMPSRILLLIPENLIDNVLIVKREHLWWKRAMSSRRSTGPRGGPL